MGSIFSTGREHHCEDCRVYTSETVDGLQYRWGNRSNFYTRCEVVKLTRDDDDGFTRMETIRAHFAETYEKLREMVLYGEWPAEKESAEWLEKREMLYDEYFPFEE
jgi:hypothetical protein